MHASPRARTGSPPLRALVAHGFFVDALRSSIIRHRPRLRRACALGAWAATLVFAAGAAMAPSWEARRFLLLYMAPFFPAFFLWARIRLQTVERDPTAALAVDALATVLAAARLTGGWLPFSGHMLFYAYAAPTTRHRGFHAIIAVLALAAAWFKLAAWGDWRSFAWGAAAGLALAAVRTAAARTGAPAPSSAT